MIPSLLVIKRSTLSSNLLLLLVPRIYIDDLFPNLSQRIASLLVLIVSNYLTFRKHFTQALLDVTHGFDATQRSTNINLYFRSFFVGESKRERGEFACAHIKKFDLGFFQF